MNIAQRARKRIFHEADKGFLKVIISKSFKVKSLELLFLAYSLINHYAISTFSQILGNKNIEILAARGTSRKCAYFPFPHNSQVSPRFC